MQPLVISPREVKLSTRTEISVRRLIPHAQLRRVGAWVFLDHFGPTPQVDGMKVQRHPHAGLQTVTWLFEGEVEHRDSLGSRQLIRPGQLNLMTAGRAVAHSEVSLGREASGARPTSLHAVQLWLALPDSVRNSAPAFQHVEQAREFRIDGAAGRVFIGEFAGLRSPAVAHSPIAGVELRVTGRTWLPLRPDWQYALLAAEGSAIVEAVELATNRLAYLEASDRTGVWIDVPAGQTALLVLLGGEPFTEEIVMWWNFVGRSHDEIVAMRALWNDQDSGDAQLAYPQFDDALGGWIPAPELPNVTLRSR